MQCLSSQQDKNWKQYKKWNSMQPYPYSPAGFSFVNGSNDIFHLCWGSLESFEYFLLVLHVFKVGRYSSLYALNVRSYLRVGRAKYTVKVASLLKSDKPGRCIRCICCSCCRLDRWHICHRCASVLNGRKILRWLGGLVKNHRVRKERGGNVVLFPG